MNKVILIGTEHSVQLGEKSPGKFASLITDQCVKFSVKGIAEEINRGVDTVALGVSTDLKISHLFADPDFPERIERGIPNDIRLDLVEEYGTIYPNINVWPQEPSKETLPKEVWCEYHQRTAKSYRIREKIWLEKILTFDIWPLLFICGSGHFEEFLKLIRNNGIEAIECHQHWMP